MPSVDEIRAQKRELAATSRQRHRALNVAMAEAREIVMLDAAEAVLNAPDDRASLGMLGMFDANEACIVMNRARIVGDASTVEDLRRAFVRLGYEVREGMHQMTRRPVFSVRRVPGVTTLREEA
jgi:hypothetical protein